MGIFAGHSLISFHSLLQSDGRVFGHYGLRDSSRLIRETLLPPVPPQMVDRQVGSDPPCPGTEVAIGAKLVPRALDARKGLHGQIFRSARVAHDAHDPGVDIALKLTYQRLERIDLAMREPLE
jgi:hypothetical protein